MFFDVKLYLGEPRDSVALKVEHRDLAALKSEPRDPAVLKVEPRDHISK